MSVLLLFGVSLLAICSEPAQAQEEAFKGRWESIKVSLGGLGFMLFIGDNGRQFHSRGAIVDAPYRLEGDILVLGRPVGERRGHKETRMKMVVRGDTLVQSANEPSQGNVWNEIIMTRVPSTKEGDHPLLGSWMWPHPSGPMAFTTFTENMMFFRLPFQIVEGTYTVEDDEAVMTLWGRSEIRWRLEMTDAGDVLIGSDGIRLRRALAYFN